jgi:hypothetical protein
LKTNQSSENINNTSDEIIDDSESSRKLKKYKIHKDYYTVNENEPASEKMENITTYI